MEILAAIGVTAIIGMSALLIFKTISFVTDLQDSIRYYNRAIIYLKDDIHNIYSMLREYESRVYILEEKKDG